MDTSTPIEVDSGSSQNNQQHSVEFLVHACQCKDISCQSLECVKMKGIIAHVKVCRVRASGNCPICMHLVEVCTSHSSNCQQDVCPVQFCHNIKNRLKQQARRGQAVASETSSLMESAVNEVFASGDSTSQAAAAATASDNGIQQRMEQLTQLLSSKPTPDSQKKTLDLLKSYPTLLSVFIRQRQELAIQNLTSNEQNDLLLNQQLHQIGGSSPLFDALMQRQKTPLTNRQENVQQQQTDQQTDSGAFSSQNKSDLLNNMFSPSSIPIPPPLPSYHFSPCYTFDFAQVAFRPRSSSTGPQANKHSTEDNNNKMRERIHQLTNKIFTRLRQAKSHSTIKHTSSLDLIHKIIRSHPRHNHHQQQSYQSEPNFRGNTTCRLFPMSSILSNILDRSSHQQNLMQLNETVSGYSGVSLFSSLIDIMKSNQLVMAAYLRHREMFRQMQTGNEPPLSSSHQQLASQIAGMSLSEDQNAEMQQVMDMFQKLNLPEEQKQELENVIVHQLTPNQTQQPDFSLSKSINEPGAKDAQH